MSGSALSAGVRHLRGLVAGRRGRDESDEQLLHAFTAERDEPAFAALVRRHGPMVLAVCRRVLGHEQDAEDAFQATFLVLARGANSLRKKKAIAGFLHGTAYRIALGAKRAACAAANTNAPAPARPSSNPSNELLWREVQALLDAEIVRLPDALRSVFVLCCLENVSLAEAARRLSLKEGTVSSRLTHARQRLQRRLSRRGVELTALLAATTLATPPASALPATTSATASPAVAALMDAGLNSISVGKVKLAAAILLMGSLLTSAGLWAYGTFSHIAPGLPGESPSTPNAIANPQTAPPKREAAKDVEIQGRVLGPDGKPKAGAKLRLVGPLNPVEQAEFLVESGKVRQLGVSASDGRFTIAVPKKPENQYLVAQTDGFGIDFFYLDSRKLEKMVEFRLMRDHAIRGRVVNTEGKPIAGVRVAVNQLNVYPDNSLDSFLVFWKNRPFNFGLRGAVKHILSGAGALFAATTDADGRFVLHGVGEERVVSLRLSGAGIAAVETWVVNRAGFDPKPYNQATIDNLPKGKRGFYGRWMLSGPDVAVAAATEKIIRGTVIEADTGRGRPGVLVKLTRKDGDDQTGGDYLSVSLVAKTDAAGRYEIHGAAKAKSYMVEVGSDAAAGYLGRGAWVTDTPGYQPLTADIRVRKGIIVTGRMLDGSTGKPLDGYVSIADLFDNPFVKEYSDSSFHSVLIWALDFRDTADGTFRAVTLPGPVLLMGKPRIDRSLYKSQVPDPKYPQYFEKRGDHYGYRGSGTTIVQEIYCKVLQLKPDVALVKHDIVLERRKILGVVKIRDDDGRPLTEVDAWGALSQIEADSCTIYDDADKKSRLLILYEPRRKLAGTLTLKAGEKLPTAVTLRPTGSVKGRLLDADGKPLAGLVVEPRYRDSVANVMQSRVHEGRVIASDAAGDFTLENLIPGLNFDLTFRKGRRDFGSVTKSADTVIEVKPGECLELGTIQLKQLPENAGE